MNVALAADPGYSVPAAPAQTASVSVARRTSTVAAGSQALGVTITTADDDRFTLSSSSFAVAARTTYSELGLTASSLNFKQSETQLTASGSMSSVSMEGNFSREELHDVAKALRDIARAIHHLNTGHLKQAAHEANKLTKLDSLSTVESTYQVATATAREVQTSVQSTPDQSAAAQNL